MSKESRKQSGVGAVALAILVVLLAIIALATGVTCFSPAT